MANKFERALGSRTIKKAAEENRAKANSPKVEYISTDLIDENPDNAKIFNMDKMDVLVNSMKTDGFGGAIDVFKKPDGRYEISSGHRRYRAAKIIGLEQIPCFVNPMQGNVARARKLVLSNIANRDMTPLDTARSIEYYVDNVLIPTGHTKPGDISKELVSTFGGSVSSIKRYRGLLKLIPELQELANDERFPYSAFESAPRLSEGAQKKLASELKEFSASHPDENGTPGFVSRKHIMDSIRDLLDAEGNYRESNNADIADRHKKKEKKEETSGTSAEGQETTNTVDETDTVISDTEKGSSARVSAAEDEQKSDDNSGTENGTTVSRDKGIIDVDEIADDGDILFFIERIKKSVQEIPYDKAEDKSVIASQLRSLRDEIDEMIEKL